MSYVDFSLVSPLGDELALRTSADQPGAFGLLVGASGLGLADRDVKLSASSGDGGRVRSVRVPPRPGTLPILVWGESEAERTANIRRLAAAVRTREGSPSPKLVASYSTGEVYELPFVYESGADKIARQIGTGGVEVPLNVIFPDPFWTARDARQVDITGATTPVGLLPDLAALKLSPSNASGVLPIQNDGEVRTWPVWRIVGPATKVDAQLGGRGWNLGPVAVGETITIDTKTNAVQLADGTNVYDRLGTAPKFFYLPPGRSDVAVTITGSAPGTWTPVGPVLRTNWVTNPRMDSTVSGWTVSGTGVTQAPTASGNQVDLPTSIVNGSNFIRLTNPISSAPGETWSGGIDVTVPAGYPAFTVAPRVYWYNGAGTISASTGAGVTINPGQTVRLSFPKVTIPAGSDGIGPFLMASGASPAGARVILSRALMEKAATEGPYFDGSLGASSDGAAAWTGTPGASTSTFSASQLVGRSAVSCFYRPRMEVVL